MPAASKAVIKALKEKRELERRLAEIDQFLRMYQQFSEGDTDTHSTGEKIESTQRSDVQPDALMLQGPRIVVLHCKTILQNDGHPLTRGQLTAELEARNVKLPGKDKESRARYVGTILWRHPQDFEHVEGKGYWLKDVLIPETDEERRELREARTI
jgi:hypothetical protein